MFLKKTGGGVVWCFGCCIQLQNRFKSMDQAGLLQEEFSSRPFENWCFFFGISLLQKKWIMIDLKYLCIHSWWSVWVFFFFSFFFLANCAGPNYWFKRHVRSWQESDPFILHSPLMVTWTFICIALIWNICNFISTL